MGFGLGAGVGDGALVGRADGLGVAPQGARLVVVRPWLPRLTPFGQLLFREGPAGFLRVIGPKRLAYADFRGNTQLVSVGNVASNDRVSLILMDYPNRRRLKILGHMRVENVQDVPTGDLAAVELPGYRAHVERVVFIDIVAFDWNCPQHITRRYTESEFKKLTQLRVDDE